MIGRSGASFGKVHYCPIDYWPLNTALFATDFLGNDPRYTYYALKTLDLTSYNSGSAQPSLNRNFIATIPMSIPPPDEQRRIVAVLAGFDEKIDSNRRLAALLEEAAAAVFRARFVDFVGIDVFDNSEIGEIPAGWAAVPFSQVVTINPSVPLGKGDLTPFIEMAAVRAWATRPDLIGERAYSGGARFEPGDTLMAKITGCIEHGKGAFADFVDAPASGSTEFLVFRAKPPLTPEEVFLLSRTERVRAHAIANMTGSSGRQRVPVSCFDNLLIAIPPERDEHAHAEFFAAVFRQSRAIWHESRTLRELRDVLLPKLLSGEIRVPDTSYQAEVIGPALEAAS